MENSEIVNHFKKEGYPIQTIFKSYANLEAQSTTKRKLIAQPPAGKNQLKRLTFKVRESQIEHLYKRIISIILSLGITKTQIIFSGLIYQFAII